MLGLGYLITTMYCHHGRPYRYIIVKRLWKNVFSNRPNVYIYRRCNSSLIVGLLLGYNYYQLRNQELNILSELGHGCIFYTSKKHHSVIHSPVNQYIIANVKLTNGYLLVPFVNNINCWLTLHSPTLSLGPLIGFCNLQSACTVGGVAK